MATLAIGYRHVAGRLGPGAQAQRRRPLFDLRRADAPWLLTLIAPAPVGLRRRGLALALGAALLALLVASARLTDNRMVWIALAAVFATAAIASAVRWPRTFMRSPWRWLAPVAALLVILGFAFADAAQERASSVFPPNTSVEATIKADPRIRLWQQLSERIGDRVWQGYGFGRRIQAEEIASELADLQLTHAHNLFASQWLQTGAVGLGLFVAMLGAIATTFVRYVRARDDVARVPGRRRAVPAGRIHRQESHRRFPVPQQRQGVLGDDLRYSWDWERGFPRAVPRARAVHAMPAPSAEIVIINCSTRELTALALVSALRHGGLPVTVIDCESTDGSIEFFQHTAAAAAIRSGAAAVAPARRDAGPDISRNHARRAAAARFRRRDPRPAPGARHAGGAAAGHLRQRLSARGEWLAAAHGGGDHKGYYAERMWIPCVMLDAADRRRSADRRPEFPPARDRQRNAAMALGVAVAPPAVPGPGPARTVRSTCCALAPRLSRAHSRTTSIATPAPTCTITCQPARTGVRRSRFGMVADGRRALPRRHPPPAAAVDAQRGQRRREPQEGRRTHRESLRRRTCRRSDRRAQRALRSASREFSACAECAAAAASRPRARRAPRSGSA